MKKPVILSFGAAAFAAFGQGTIINNAGSLSGATVITVDTPDSSSVGGLPALGVTVSSLDVTATPFISNVGGSGVGPLPNNALGNNRVGQFSDLSDAPAYDLAAIRSFQITLANPVSALGFSVYGWGGPASDPTIQFYDPANNPIGTYLFS